MRRRNFIAGLGVAAMLPRSARAQFTKTSRIAIVHPDIDERELGIASTHVGYRALFEELKRLGYSEGVNLVVGRYSAHGRTDLNSQLARDIVATAPAVILATNGALVVALVQATTSIPIVGVSSDPVALGVVPNLNRPGGNITGVSVDQGPELWGKRLAILREAAPQSANFGYLTTRFIWERMHRKFFAELAERAGIWLKPIFLEDTIDESSFQRLFSTMKDDRVDALLVGEDATFFRYRNLIVERVAANRIPALYTHVSFIEAGGMIVHTNDLVALYRYAANQIDQILKGTFPGDIPYWLAAKYNLSINIKTARQLGLEIPATLLVAADEVIE